MPGCWNFFAEPVRGLDARKSMENKMVTKCQGNCETAESKFKFNDRIEITMITYKNYLWTAGLIACPNTFLDCYHFRRFESQNLKGHFGSDSYAMPKA